MRLFIVGTGTDVGKTHVSACLLAHARGSGVRAVAYKPIATGMEGLCEDAERHAAALGAAYMAPSFAYRRPVSPHLAAREEGPPIDLTLVRSRADELERDGAPPVLAEGGAHPKPEVLLIEAAGGLFTPLGDGVSNADLALCLAPNVTLLVAPDRVGVLHDVTACLLAAGASHVAITAVVLSAPAVADASTGENAAELETLGLGPVLGVFPRASVDDAASQAVAAAVWAALGRLATRVA